MRRKSKINYKEWLFIIIAWVILYYFYFIVAYWGISDFLKGAMKVYLHTWLIHFEFVMGAVLTGLFFILIDTIINKTGLRRQSFGYIIFVKSILYVCVFLFVFLLIYAIYYIFKIGPGRDLNFLTGLLTYKFIVSMVVFYLFSVVLINFSIQVNRKFGPGNLYKLLTGKYHKPRDDYRIFLFIDLTDSTRLAEKLGHNTYSQLLRNCYHDLTDVVIKYKAEIYQYVGDEVVLSWNIKEGMETLNCLKTFFAYENKLHERKEFYLKNYDTIPEFKGGMDIGTVTIAEIGDIKREIAYHGDVLNTASRILSVSKEKNKGLIISDRLLDKLPQKNGEITFEPIGPFELKGKTKVVNLIVVTKTENE